MADYKQLYFQLFAALADAVEALEAANYGRARDILTAAQQLTEEQFMDADE